MRHLTRYFRLWSAFLKMSFMADLEYRVNVVLRVIGELFWYAMQLSVFEVLYTHTNSISGWDVNEMRVFMGTLFLTDVVYMILFHENMDQMASAARSGDLDLYLVKPVNSQFMVSMRKIGVAYFANLLLTGSYFIWAVSRLEQSVGPAQLLTYIPMCALGLTICYSLRFMFATVSVVLQGAANVQFLWHQFYRLATRPDPLYPSFVRFTILSVFPLAFFASVPARVVVEGISWDLVAAAIFLAAFTLWLSNFFWERALRRYASTSS